MTKETVYLFQRFEYCHKVFVGLHHFRLRAETLQTDIRVTESALGTKMALVLFLLAALGTEYFHSPSVFAVFPKNHWKSARKSALSGFFFDILFEI